MKKKKLWVFHICLLYIYIKPELPSLPNYTSYLSTADTAAQLSPNSIALLLQRHNICFSSGCIMAAFRQRHGSGIVVGTVVGIC